MSHPHPRARHAPAQAHLRSAAHSRRRANGRPRDVTAPAAVYESDVEEVALHWLEELGWTPKFGPSLAPGELFAERESYDVPYLPGRLRDALERLNPDIPSAGI